MIGRNSEIYFFKVYDTKIHIFSSIVINTYTIRKSLEGKRIIRQYIREPQWPLYELEFDVSLFNLIKTDVPEATEKNKVYGENS